MTKYSTAFPISIFWIVSPVSYFSLLLSISPIFPSGIFIVLTVSPIFPVAGSLEGTPFSLHWHSFYHISFLDFKPGQKCENLSSSVEEMAVQLFLAKLMRNVKLWPLNGSSTATNPFVFGGISGPQVVHK